MSGPRCTCTPPDGVTRNHKSPCALFDVRLAYRQGRSDATDGLLSAEYELWDGRKLVVTVTEEDPGDLAEPRSVSEDDVTYLSVRAAHAPGLTA